MGGVKAELDCNNDEPRVDAAAESGDNLGKEPESDTAAGRDEGPGEGDGVLDSCLVIGSRDGCGAGGGGVVVDEQDDDLCCCCFCDGL